MKKAVFPGTFDPITLGHVSIVKRAIPLFDSIVIAVGNNTEKKHLYPLEKRMAWIQEVFKNEHKVNVESYQGLTVDFCKKMEAQYILRGLRTNTDFDFENAIGQMNRKISTTIETVFLLALPEHTFISSTIVRDIIKNGGDASPFLPEQVKLGYNN